MAEIKSLFPEIWLRCLAGSPKSLPRIFLSANSVNPSFNQKCSQLTFVTKFPVQLLVTPRSPPNIYLVFLFYFQLRNTTAPLLGESGWRGRKKGQLEWREKGQEQGRTSEEGR